MYNRMLRETFETVGDLKRLLKDVSDDAKIVVCGDSNCWFHIEKDLSTICLDNEDLEECYEG